MVIERKEKYGERNVDLRVTESVSRFSCNAFLAKTAMVPLLRTIRRCHRVFGKMSSQHFAVHLLVVSLCIMTYGGPNRTKL